MILLVAGGLLWTWAFGKPESDGDQERSAKAACSAFVETFMDGSMSMEQLGTMVATSIDGGYEVSGRADHAEGRNRPWACVTVEAGGEQKPEAVWTS